VDTETSENSNSQSFSLTHAQPELIAGIVAAAVVAAAAWTVSGNTCVLAWIVTAQVVYGTRFWWARKLRLKAKYDAANSDGKVSLQVGLAATGLLWGSASVGCLFSHGLNWLTGIVLVTTVALSVLVLGCYLGRRALVLTFAAAAIVPIGVAGLLLLEKAAVVVGIASLLFMAVISIAAKYIDRLAESYYKANSERDEYFFKVQTSEQEIKRLQVGVKTNTDKRLALEGELGEASSNLMVVEGKAEALASALDRVMPYDPETGLLNAKKYTNVIDREWARMLRQELPITVVHMQIDNFDEYMESYGKMAYEAAMRRIAVLMRQAGTRPGDVVARLDDNKFALLFPEADHKNGENLADVLRQQIRRLNMPNLSSPMHSAVTASFGVCTVIPNSDLSIEEFMQRADAALYEAQFQGGDNVVRYRTMNTIKLERWNCDHEGELTPDGLLRKLAVLGYESKARTYEPGEYQGDRRIQIDTIDAIVQGKLKVSLEGEARTLHPGDLLFIPKGLVTSAEVVGEKSVICLEATRA
jgi:diguanylate cyclase (GGDEF)-like protein